MHWRLRQNSWLASSRVSLHVQFIPVCRLNRHEHQIRYYFGDSDVLLHIQSCRYWSPSSARHYCGKVLLLTSSTDLTGTHPESAQLSLAGTTHDLDIKTPYYSATVPIWLDLITTPTEWAGTFLSDEAKEVLEVLGGVVAVFAIPPSTSQSSTQDDSVKALIKEVGRVVKEGLGGWEWDGVSLAVGVGEVSHLDDLDVWDEICGDAGLEFVHVASSASEDARNEFGGEWTTPFRAGNEAKGRMLTSCPSRKGWYPSRPRGATIQ